MLPLFDMLANAQNGKGIDLLARQFNLTQQQTELALEALLPAFSQGLKRNTSDPYGIAGFMTALASGQHGQYFDNAARAFSPDGDGRRQRHPRPSVRLEGPVARGCIAGGASDRHRPERAAADAAGDRRDADGRPVQAVDQSDAGRQVSARSNPLGEIIEQMMRQGGAWAVAQRPAAAQPAPQSAPDPFDNPFGKVLKDMFGGGAPAPRSATGRGPTPNVATDNPFGKILEEMLGGASRAPDPQPEPDPQPAPRQRANPSGRARNPYDDIFGDMFETGRKTRDDYQKGVELVFDQFLRGMDNPR